jgi:hypothetical protein
MVFTLVVFLTPQLCAEQLLPSSPLMVSLLLTYQSTCLLVPSLQIIIPYLKLKVVIAITDFD